MEAWGLWGVTPKNPSDNAKHKPRQHGTLTPSTSSVDLSHQGYIDFAGQTQSKTTLHLAENSNDFLHHKESGREGPILLLLVFFSTLIILQWRLWPSYNAQLWESFHGASGILGTRSINETDHILSQLRANGTTPCHNAQTNFTLIFNLRFEDYDPTITPLSLSTNTLHTIFMDSYSADGVMRCSGGDYYETILYNYHWRSRPQVQDLGNGSYRISLFVDSHVEGLFNFSASLLFRNFHGLEHMTGSWAVQAQVAFFQVEFYSVNIVSKSRNDHQGPNSKLTMTAGEIPQQFRMCSMDDKNFQQKEWTGRRAHSHSLFVLCLCSMLLLACESHSLRFI